MYNSAPNFRGLFPAREFFAILLLCSVVIVAVPFVTVSAGSICTLDCCAGRAPHAAGSCMSGACHAAITIKRHARGRRTASLRSDVFCGLSFSPATISNRLAVKRTIRDPSSTKTSQKESTQREFSATSFGRPCPPDCSGWASGFTNLNQQRNSAAFTHAKRPGAPSGTRLRYLHEDFTQARVGLCRRCIPRGPPTFFS